MTNVRYPGSKLTHPWIGTQTDVVAAPADVISAAAAGIVSPGQNLIWRSDLDPRALPASEKFTSSQLAILSACLELFADQGYAATSVRDIAGLIGIKAASLYKSFPSKQAMLDALSELGHNEFSRRQLAAVLAVGDDPREQLAAGMRVLVVMTCQYPRLTRIVNNEVRNLSPAGFARDQAARTQTAQVLHDVLERGKASGVFLVPDEPALTVLIWGLGVALSGWFPYTHDVQPESLADTYADIALRIVGAQI